MRALQRRRVEGGVEVVTETNVQWRRYVGPWRVLMQFSGEGLKELAERLTDHTLGMQAVRVLLACLQTTNRENQVHAGRKDLARMLGMPESNVAKALTDLVEAGFLERPGLRYSPYVVSPRFFWRGNTGDLKRALSERGMLDKNGMMGSRAA